MRIGIITTLSAYPSLLFNCPDTKVAILKVCPLHLSETNVAAGIGRPGIDSVDNRLVVGVINHFVVINKELNVVMVLNQSNLMHFI